MFKSTYRESVRPTPAAASRVLAGQDAGMIDLDDRAARGGGEGEGGVEPRFDRPTENPDRSPTVARQTDR